MTADEILKITKCGDLFSVSTVDGIKAEYKELVKSWHPDVTEDAKAVDVMVKIQDLYSTALSLAERNEWEKTGYKFFTDDKGKRVIINYKHHVRFELGEIYLHDDATYYVIDEGKDKYVKNMIEQSGCFQSTVLNAPTSPISLTFAAKYCRPSLFMLNLKDGRTVLFFTERENRLGGILYTLEEIYEFYNHKVPIEHFAWIMSRLCNINCITYSQGKVSNGFDMKSMLVSPETHDVFMRGCYFYMTDDHHPMIGTTSQIYNLLSPSVKISKVSEVKTDIESIKAIGRMLLGYKSTHEVALAKDIPDTIREFLMRDGSNPIEEFKAWDSALDTTFGNRRFIKMDITDIRKGE